MKFLQIPAKSFKIDEIFSAKKVHQSSNSIHSSKRPLFIIVMDYQINYYFLGTKVGTEIFIMDQNGNSLLVLVKSKQIYKGCKVNSPLVSLYIGK